MVQPRDSVLIHLLVVEDSDTQALKLKSTLEENGKYRVSVAANGVAALKSIETDRPEIIISDIVMPEMDGYALCKAIKSDQNLKDIIVILLTQLNDPMDVVHALQCGADNFLTKPWDEDFLFKRLEYLTAHRLDGARPDSDDVNVMIAGKEFSVSSRPRQIVDLLVSTYEDAIRKNNEIQRAHAELYSVYSQLAKKNDELRRLNEEKGRFLGMTAHDLRSPLVNIMGFCEFLKAELHGMISGEHMKFLKIIESSGKHMLKVVGDLLDITAIESGKLTLDFREIDLAALVTYSAELHKTLAYKKQISIEKNIVPGPVMVRADARKVEQVLDNLLTNAIKFSHTNTKVLIHLAANDSEAIVLVKDEGQGIPEGEQEKIFKPYPHISVKSTAGEPSTGLGLALAHNIVVAHNGRMWMESEVGKGSTFGLALNLLP